MSFFQLLVRKLHILFSFIFHSESEREAHLIDPQVSSLKEEDCKLLFCIVDLIR